MSTSSEDQAATTDGPNSQRRKEHYTGPDLFSQQQEQQPQPQPKQESKQDDSLTFKEQKGQASQKAPSFWERYFDEQGDHRLQEISKLAPNDSYDVEIINDSTGVTEKRSFKRYKISTKVHKELEDKRAELDKIRRENITNPDAAKVEQITRMLADLYFRCAQVYFHMTLEEFESTSWEDMKLVLDACTFRTLYGLPYTSKNSSDYSSMIT